MASEKKNNTIIHGLSEFEENNVDKYLIDCSEKGINETQNLSKILNRPLLKIELPAAGRLNSNNQYFFFINNILNNIFSLFVAKKDGDNNEYNIGRSVESTITIPLNTISRKQCKFILKLDTFGNIFLFLRIFYLDGEWYIVDGDMIKGGPNNDFIFKESANGTWVSLLDYRMKNERQESEPRILEDETEIKISETILKVIF